MSLVSNYFNKVNSEHRNTSQGCVITTGDYIDPTPWTPETYERLRKAIDRVNELNNQSEIQNFSSTETI
jgi:hypothetical protein